MVADGEGLAKEAGACEAAGVEPFGEFLGCEAVAGCGEMGGGGGGRVVGVRGGKVRMADARFYVGKLGVDGFGDARGREGG